MSDEEVIRAPSLTKSDKAFLQWIADNHSADMTLAAQAAGLGHNTEAGRVRRDRIIEKLDALVIIESAVLIALQQRLIDAPQRAIDRGVNKADIDDDGHILAQEMLAGRSLGRQEPKDWATKRFTDTRYHLRKALGLSTQASTTQWMVMLYVVFEYEAQS